MVAAVDVRRQSWLAQSEDEQPRGQLTVVRHTRT